MHENALGIWLECVQFIIGCPVLECSTASLSTSMGPNPSKSLICGLLMCLGMCISRGTIWISSIRGEECSRTFIQSVAGIIGVSSSSLLEVSNLTLENFTGKFEHPSKFQIKCLLLASHLVSNFSIVSTDFTDINNQVFPIVPGVYEYVLLECSRTIQTLSDPTVALPLLYLSVDVCKSDDVRICLADCLCRCGRYASAFSVFNIPSWNEWQSISDEYVEHVLSFASKSNVRVTVVCCTALLAVCKDILTQMSTDALSMSNLSHKDEKNTARNIVPRVELLLSSLSSTLSEHQALSASDWSSLDLECSMALIQCKYLRHDYLSVISLAQSVLMAHLTLGAHFRSAYWSASVRRLILCLLDTYMCCGNMSGALQLLCGTICTKTTFSTSRDVGVDILKVMNEKIQNILWILPTACEVLRCHGEVDTVSKITLAVAQQLNDDDTMNMMISMDQCADVMTSSCRSGAVSTSYIPNAVHRLLTQLDVHCVVHDGAITPTPFCTYVNALVVLELALSQPGQSNVLEHSMMANKLLSLKRYCNPRLYMDVLRSNFTDSDGALPLKATKRMLLLMTELGPLYYSYAHDALIKLSCLTTNNITACVLLEICSKIDAAKMEFYSSASPSISNLPANFDGSSLPIYFLTKLGVTASFVTETDKKKKSLTKAPTQSSIDKTKTSSAPVRDSQTLSVNVSKIDSVLIMKEFLDLIRSSNSLMDLLLIDIYKNISKLYADKLSAAVSAELLNQLETAPDVNSLSLAPLHSTSHHHAICSWTSSSQSLSCTVLYTAKTSPSISNMPATPSRLIRCSNCDHNRIVVTVPKSATDSIELKTLFGVNNRMYCNMMTSYLASFSSNDLEFSRTLVDWRRVAVTFSNNPSAAEMMNSMHV